MKCSFVVNCTPLQQAVSSLLTLHYVFDIDKKCSFVVIITTQWVVSPADTYIHTYIAKHTCVRQRVNSDVHCPHPKTCLPPFPHLRGEECPWPIVQVGARAREIGPAWHRYPVSGVCRVVRIRRVVSECSVPSPTLHQHRGVPLHPFEWPRHVTFELAMDEN